MPSYQRVKTVVRRHTDQMIRTRNVRARNERIETGIVVKSQKGKHVSIERTIGECHGKQMDSQEETLAVFTRKVVVSRHDGPFLLQRRKHRMTEEDLRAAGKHGICEKCPQAQSKGQGHIPLPY